MIQTLEVKGFALDVTFEIKSTIPTVYNPKGKYIKILDVVMDGDQLTYDEMEAMGIDYDVIEDHIAEYYEGGALWV